MQERGADTGEEAAKHWLAVPYAERREAKRRGAEWDGDAKCWYAPRGADLTKLARWEPSAVSDYAPALGAREEFAQALRELGFEVAGEHPIMDGRPHRIRTHGDKAREKAGFYVASLAGVPSGYAMDNRTGRERAWRAKGVACTPEEIAQARAVALKEQQAREQERQRIHEAEAERLAKQLADYIPLTGPTRYLVAKGLSPLKGVFTDRAGAATIVPGYDVGGKLWTLQYIAPDGGKRFAAGARQAGCCHPVGGWQAVASAPVLLLAEGYSTALTLALVLQRPTIACFSASNLVAVAEGLQERFPGKSIVIAADDDRALKQKLDQRYGARDEHNPGQYYAQRAAAAVGGVVVSPVFAPGEDALTDFNDLATKSVLGRSALEVQLGAAIAAVEVAQRDRPRTSTRGLDGDGRARGRVLRHGV